MNTQFITQYTHTRERSAEYGTINDKDTMTVQSDARDTDINIIMKRYSGSGQLPTVIQQPLYGDFTEVGDYRTAVDKVRQANEAFLEIPAEIRQQFNNDPHAFMEYVRDPANREDLRKMGLAIPKSDDNIIVDAQSKTRRYDDDTPYEDINDGNTGTRANQRTPAVDPAGRPGNRPDDRQAPLRNRETVRQDGDRGPGQGR